MNTKAAAAVWAFGPRKLGPALDPPMTDSAVYAWLNKPVRPRFDVAKQIVELLNKGRKKADRLTVEDVMAPNDSTAPRVDRRFLPRKPATTTTKGARNG